MRNIGNDIVDLNLAEIQSNWQRKGFLEKQFTQQEQQEIHHSDNPFLKVWQFWSMKEAAYKCYTQKVTKRFFAPQKFECSLTKEDEGNVIFENLKFYTSTCFNEFYIHTLAKDFVELSNQKLRIFSATGSRKIIKNELKLRLSKKTGFSSEEIEKKKNAIGAPLYYYKEKLITKSCSISHHGNYAAFAFTLNNES